MLLKCQQRKLYILPLAKHGNRILIMFIFAVIQKMEPINKDLSKKLRYPQIFLWCSQYISHSGSPQ